MNTYCQTLYSNISGDFVATPIDSTKEIVFSDIKLPLELTSETFIDFSVRRKRGDVSEDLPTDEVTWDGTDTLTLHDATDFETGDLVSVTITGVPRGFFSRSENTAKGVLDTAIKKVVGAQYAGTPFNVIGAVNTVTSSESQLNSLWVQNNGAVNGYLHIYDSISGPSVGSVPLYWEPIGTGKTPLDKLIYCAFGITLAVSAVRSTYTSIATPSNIEMGGFYT